MRIKGYKRIPLKYIKDIIKCNTASWEYGFPGCTKFNYWLSVLQWFSDKYARLYNYIFIATENKKFTGYLQAYIYRKRKCFHPLLFLTYWMSTLLLRLSAQGRNIDIPHRIYTDYMLHMTRIAQYIIKGEDYKNCNIGVCVAVVPEYRKQCVYRELDQYYMENSIGPSLAFSDTESVYQAHINIGYKKLFECAYPKFTYCTYGNGHEKAMMLAVYNDDEGEPGQVYTSGLLHELIKDVKP